MRLVFCAVSAIALSGCSWLGGFGHNDQKGHSYNTKSAAYGHTQRQNVNPCQILSPQHPIPRGCNPASVTIATPNQGATNGFPQKPNFGQPEYTTGQYGSHAANASQQGANYQSNVPNLRKPKFRGTLSLGGEKSFNGEILNYDKFPTNLATGLSTDPTFYYDPQDYDEGSFEGSPADGSTTRYTYTAGPLDRTSGDLYDKKAVPNLSFDDAWSTPVSIAVGGEYILSPRNTLFANVGYSAAAGDTVTIADVTATIYRDAVTQLYDTTTLQAVGAPITSTAYVPDEQIANFNTTFTDMERYDLEVGGRHYFNPLNKNDGLNTVTPFVGAAIGTSHYNAASYTTGLNQRHYGQAFDDPTGEATQFFRVHNTSTTVDLYDSQWVPTGQLNAGVEWQVTPRTGLAFETGVRVEGARKYANDEKGDKNIAIPFTIRGSYNF